MDYLIATVVIVLLGIIFSLFIPFLRKTIGLLLVILGILATLTFIGALIGIPMIIVGGILLFIDGDDPSPNIEIKNENIISKEPNEIRIECPFCAELIKPTAKICRYCGKEITERSLEESGFTKQCPSCFRVLKPNLDNCIYCKVDLYVCEECDSYVLEGDQFCPTCGANFDED